MKTITLFLFIFIALHVQSQSLKKAFKALDEKQFVEAKNGFDDYRTKDSLDPQVWFGYARLFAEPGFVEGDLFLSWKYIMKSRALYEGLDDKGKKKLGDDLNLDSLSIWDKLLDDRLFAQVKSGNSLELYEKHLTLCSGSWHKDEVLLLRNAKAFSDAKTLNTVSAYNAFMSNYPDAAETKEALILRDAAAYADAARVNTVESFQSFLDSFPNAADFQRAFDARNGLMLDKAIAFGTEEAITEFLMVMAMGDTPEHRVKAELYEKAFVAQRAVNAKFHWVYYTSAGNLYRLNESTMKSELLVKDGNIRSFAVNPSGDVVYYRIVKPELMEFYNLKINSQPEKMCDLKTDAIISSYSGDVLPIYISDDLNVIYMDCWMEPEAWYTSMAAWTSTSKKWTICAMMEQNCDLGIGTSIVNKASIGNSSACPDSKGDYFTRMTNNVYELYKRNGGTDIQISHTSDIQPRSAWGEETQCFSYSLSATKIMYYFIQECGDFCYGPCYVANTDGTGQVPMTTSTTIADLEAHWLYTSGDLLWIDDDKNLIRFAGKEQSSEVLAPDVTMVKTVEIKP